MIWFLLIGHRLILYHGGDGHCGPMSGAYATFDAYLEAIVNGVLPPILTAVLAYLLIRSVRNLANRQTNPTKATTSVHRTSIQQIDAQLSTMLILQSIISTITYGPYAVNLIYGNATEDDDKSALRIAQENVFFQATDLGSYIFFTTSFYVSMISSSGFRRQFKKVIWNRKRIRPVDQTQTQTAAHVAVSF